MLDDSLKLIASVYRFDGHVLPPLGCIGMLPIYQGGSDGGTNKILEAYEKNGTGTSKHVTKSRSRAVLEIPFPPLWIRGQESYCGGDSGRSGR